MNQATSSLTRADIDYHIEFDERYYSVPYNCLRCLWIAETGRQMLTN
jgi:hypothetical protein